MPEEQVELTEKELAAVERLAKRYGLTTEDVIETLFAAALVQHCGRELREPGR